MKTIEERAAIYFGVLEEKRLPRVIFEDILRELAADLNAENENEVAELRKKHHEYVNLSLAEQKEQSALLDEVKRVLVETQPHVCSLCCPSVKKDGTDWVHVEECQQMTRLIYRLGGSHE